MQCTSAMIDEMRAALAAAGDYAPLAQVRTLDLARLVELLHEAGRFTGFAPGGP